MQIDILARYDRSVPRYTSYPTAPHFTEAVNGAVYRRWLTEIAPETRASLYLHIPFCRELCWYCGCNMRVVRRDGPVMAYAETLITEIDQVADSLPARLPVGHVHFGGGSPNTLAPETLARLMDHLRHRFDLDDETEIAVEIDPRTTTDAFIQACGETGVTRASIGIQDMNADVQQAVNRIQPYDMIVHVLETLSKAGIHDLNADLMYGLPRQTVDKVVDTVDQTLSLDPTRVALFGYAHVPWMKKHMRLINEAELPDGPARWGQFEAATERLNAAGYIPIGMDHFARPQTQLANAAKAGALHRNFQGYTVDDSTVLLGFGASAIGALPQGYIQNDPDVRRWRSAIETGELATVRGRELTHDDRVRRAIIERLMCDMAVDVDAVARAHESVISAFTPALDALQGMVRDGLVEISGTTVRMTATGRPLVRAAASAFDSYLERSENAAPRHARAV